MNKPSLIVVDDDASEVAVIIGHATELGFRHVLCRSIAETRRKWQEENGFDVVVLDLNVDAEGNGLEFVHITRESPGLRLPTVIIFSGFVDRYQIPVRLCHDLGHIHAYDKGDHNQVAQLKAELKNQYEKIMGMRGSKPVVASRLLKDLHDELPVIARSGLSVLITGPTGTGKEHIARRIAEISSRSRELIRTVNCAAFSEHLLMSELFGHVRGSFTGADAHRLGLVLEASGYKGDGTKGSKGKEYITWLSARERSTPEPSSATNGEVCYALPKGTVGGTLILDEVVELAPTAQASLLRVLDGLPIKPVGYDGSGFLPNVRVIAMTNDIDTLGEREDFRHDLLGRLNEWHIDVPPIENRPDDAREIVNQTAGQIECRARNIGTVRTCFEIDDGAMAAFLRRLVELKGGIRELRSWAHRACLFAEKDQKSVVSDEHVNAAWNRSFRLAGRSAHATDGGHRASVKADDIRKQLRDLIPTLPENFTFSAFHRCFMALDYAKKRAPHELLWELLGKGSSFFEQRREVFIAMRPNGWEKPVASIDESNLQKLSNQLSKVMPRSRPFGAA